MIRCIEVTYAVVDDILFQILVTIRVEVIGEYPTPFFGSRHGERADTCEDVRDDVFGFELLDEPSVFCMKPGVPVYG